MYGGRRGVIITTVKWAKGKAKTCIDSALWCSLIPVMVFQLQLLLQLIYLYDIVKAYTWLTVPG